MKEKFKLIMLDVVGWRNFICSKSKSLKLDQSLYLKIKVSRRKVEVLGHQSAATATRFKNDHKEG